MRILITGGAGCLGSNLIEEWVPAGHEVLAIDNFATGKREALPDVPGLKYVEGSIVDPDLVERAFSEFQPSHVVHSAAAYKDPQDWGEDAATNVQGTINVVKAAERHKVKRLINFQTALCYGRPNQVPIPVDHPVQPFTSYGISKTAGEQYCLMSSVPNVSLRLANVTGPRLAIGPIPTFYQRLKAGKDCFCSETIRDFIDMQDFKEVVSIVMDEGAPTGVFNISTGEGHTIKDVFDTVQAYLNIDLEKPVPVVPPGEDDVPAVVLDPSQTDTLLGWSAKYDFSETIERMLAWYDAYGVSDVYSHLAEPTVE